MSSITHHRTTDLAEMTEEPIIRLQKFLDTLWAGQASLMVLEAGCGSASYICFGREAHISGIDISEQQLQRNMTITEKILGDIQYYRFPPSQFDAIICWDVLEHLQKPELTLLNFANAIRRDGVVILKMPNVLSLKGLLTKFLPHPIHVLFYRYIYGIKSAGQDNTPPFKAYLQFSITPAAIKKFAVDHGMRVVYFDRFDISKADWFRRMKIALTLYMIVKKFSSIVSFIKLTDSEFIIVLRKSAEMNESHL